MSFLDRSFELHFNERPFLNHFSYLFITKTTRERSRSRSNFSILCRGNIIPKEVRDKDAVSRFLESVDQFERILNDSAFIRLERLTTDEIVGTPQQAGLIEKYFSLSQQDTTTLKDIQMSASKMRIGDNTLCVHTLSDVDDLPGSVQTDTRYEKYSTDRSDCRLSFAAPVGLMLSCDHIYNQFLFIDDSAEILQRFEKTARNMHSLSKYSRANQLNKQWIDAYLDEAHSFGLTAICCHCNVMAWSDNREKLKVIKNDTGSALALMGCKPRYNTIDAPALYWAGIPGGEGDFPSEESFFTFVEQGVCFFTEETNYADSLSPFGIKMADRTNGKPLHLDISDEPMRRGITTNRNKLVIGPSGSGKSTFLRCINLLERPTEGSVVIDGTAMETLSPAALRERRRDITMIFQQFNLLMQRSCLKNICFPMELAGVKKADAEKRARELLEMVGLPDKANAYPAQLSGGQKQRIAIARALATNPKVLLCDEATSALDPNTTHAILTLIKDINKKLGITVVVITHQMSVVEEICDSVAILDGGVVVEQGEVREIFANPKTAAARRLVAPNGGSAARDLSSFAPDDHVVRVTFNGSSAAKPLVASLAAEKGILVSVLSADTRDLSGQCYGSMLLKLPRDTEQAKQAAAYMRSQNGVTVEEVTGE